MRPAVLPFAYLKDLSRGKKVQQTGVLYVSLLASLVLGIASSVITTRLLGPQAFGDFKFVQTIWSVCMMSFTFGLFTTGGILLAAKDSQEAERSLFGGLLVMACGISMLFVLFMALVSIPVSRIYGQAVGNTILLYAPLVFVFPLQVLLQEALRGTNNIVSLGAAQYASTADFYYDGIGG